jgi:F0F1-type ATP synthase gamma subunit
MVSIANQTIQNYLGGLDENVKKEVFHVLASKGEDLETEYTNLKENTINSLKTIMESQEDSEVKNKLTETIDKITSEKFDQVNFVRLKHLNDSIQHQS